MDYLTVVLCLCIGNAVAWLIALYTETGAYRLLWNLLLGTIGAGLCAMAIALIAPALGVVGLVLAGPLCALLMIAAGQAVKRRLSA